MTETELLQQISDQLVALQWTAQALLIGICWNGALAFWHMLERVMKQREWM